MISIKRISTSNFRKKTGITHITIKPTGEIMAFNENRRDGGNFGGPIEMHKAVCADCKQETEVPFKPAGDRPVYCRDCYQKHRKL